MSKEQSLQPIGDFFSHYKFPLPQRVRISIAVKAGDLPAVILKDYARGTDCYKVFKKTESVSGFRQGHPGFYEGALRKISDYLSGPEQHRRYDISWDIYQASAVAYIQAQLPDLQRLLLEVQKPESDDVSAMLKGVCSSAFSYDVSKEDVEAFYEIWGLERVDDFEGILALCDRGDEEGMHKRAVRQNQKAVSAIENSVERLAEELLAQTEAGSKARELIKRAEGRLSSVEKDLKTGNAGLTKISESLVSKIALSAELDSTARKMAIRVGAVEKALSELTSSVKESKHDIGGATAQLRKDSDRTVVEGAELARQIVDLEERLTRAEAQSADSAVQLPNKNETRFSGYKSPLIRSAGDSNVEYGVEDEFVFVDSWRAQLRRNEGVALTFSEALAIHRTFLAQRVVVVELPLVCSWIRQLGWDPFVLNLAASPVWSAEEDWGAGAEHLFTENDSKPRFLIIHNYDVGLADCYLAPSLVLWAMAPGLNPLAKLFLVPSSAEVPHSPQILERSANLARERPASERISLRQEHGAPVSASEIPSSGVDPKHVLRWGNSTRRIEANAMDFLMGEKLGVPPAVVTRFLETSASLNHYFEENDAMIWAATAHVLPWAQARYGSAGGEGVVAEFVARLDES